MSLVYYFLEHGVHSISHTHSFMLCTFCSTQPTYLHSILNYRTPTRSANTNLLSAPRVRTTLAVSLPWF